MLSLTTGKLNLTRLSPHNFQHYIRSIPLYKNAISHSREKGVKMNPDKVTLRLTEMRYFGKLPSTDGLKPQTDRVTDMPAPTNPTELATVLGMANNLPKLVPGLAETTAPPRHLLKKVCLKK